MLEIDHLSKNYKDFHLNCSLKVLPGRITGLIGANGAGKSTTFKAALGLIRADGGKITLLGKDSRAVTAADRKRLGVVLSDSGFSGYLNVKDLVPVMARLYDGFDREEFLGKCRKAGLPLDKKIKEFSTGMKAKLKLLAAISHGAQLLILDEPTAGLDVVARDELLTMLREFMEEGDRGILISSHISPDLENLCDDVYMIHEGNIVLHEDMDVLMGEYAVLKVSDKQYASLDRQYILRQKKEEYGYLCLTDQRRFYLENAPGVVVEKSTLDELIFLMILGQGV